MTRRDSDPLVAPAFRPVPRTGVIYVTTEARKRGFRSSDASWSNLGQGMPETGSLEGAPPRITQVSIDEADQEYAPVAGIQEARETVAQMYNELFRRGRSSKYTAQNVALSGGGRVSLMRACAAIAPVHLGHFLPDYTAYTELLDVFRRFSPIPILLDPEREYTFTPDELRREVLGRGLGAVLASNPCNPTGRVVEGAELAAWVDTARALDCTLLLDEFYSHYIWKGDRKISSAAEFVDDVNRDPVVIVDGLTKNWRYPGWRTTWVLGPAHVIDAVSSAGSFLDGGGARPLQRAALPLLTREHALAETEAIRARFLDKRSLLLDGLREVGITFDLEPEGTFYAWGNLSKLPASIRDGEDFFRAALDAKVVVVPGAFFDVDPGSRRNSRPSRFRHHVRFSYGPTREAVERGVLALKDVVSKAR